ncbi:DUF3592 domain-containing protein [Hymenobacter sp. 15J16-1T3B]|uniref:DUF3592 domain-containing protein n=1 Tax=Hymenobacter sp. 15J16-1T3B TaxID=2886941 RepID=UPI001D1111ED|nr:DUF3592 domain-containing protein [Hymenobacter sp. 15J16-1T3B]MCC3159886.1 DUF3592 domain-containing protein [Hymenobacter sp. 15J16-1T3B]
MHISFPAEAVIFLLMGLFFAGASLYGRRLQRARQQRGQLAEATIVALTPTRQLFTPKVRFMTAAGHAVEIDTETAADADQYHVGQQVQVIYDPANPENADLAAATGGGYGYGLLVGLLFAGVGVLQMLGVLPVFEQYAH